MKRSILTTYVVSLTAHSFEEGRDKHDSQQFPEHAYEHTYANRQTTRPWLFS